MVSKFDNYLFWKHKNCIDVFVYIDHIRTDEDNLIVRGDWMCQGIESYWTTPLTNDTFVIKSDQFDNWIPYEPKGKYYGS